MEEIINGLKQIKTRIDSGTITTVNGTETLLSKQLAYMLEIAINYTRCCTELPNKMVIELSDEEMQIVSTDELIQMEKEAMEFDGFEGWIVRGKAAILK